MRGSQICPSPDKNLFPRKDELSLRYTEASITTKRDGTPTYNPTVSRTSTLTPTLCLTDTLALIVSMTIYTTKDLQYNIYLSLNSFFQGQE